MALVMRMKGQNGISPCWICEIKGVRFNRTYYVPLRREKIPGAEPHRYLPFCLGLCFCSWCVFRLPMHLPPRDSSSASRPVFRTASHYGPVFRLPSHSIPWLLGLPPPFRDIPQCLAQSARHSPWHPLHRYVFRCTAARSRHTASLPPLCRIFWLHHCISRCSALLTTAWITAVFCLEIS